MTQGPTNILAIGINRQRVGIAVFCRDELEYVTGRALPSELSRLGRRSLMADLGDLIRGYQIGIVTMHQLTVQQSDSRAVKRVYQSVQSHAIRHGLTLVIDGSASRHRSGRMTEENLASLYPELRRYLGDAAWERRYYRHIFKAVSAGVRWLTTNEVERMSNDG